MALLVIGKTAKCLVIFARRAVTQRTLSNLSNPAPSPVPDVRTHILFNEHFTSEEDKAQFVQGMQLLPDFITVEEEKILLNEIQPLMKGRRYEGNHWDGAITHYREVERLEWNEESTEILNKVKKLAFVAGTQPLKYVHILDLRHDGVIKPHVDSVKFCGTTIAGISLLSDSVMRLRRENDNKVFVDVLLKQRSLYIMTGSARYDYTHEILSGKDSVFGDVPVPKTRRISVICRNEP